MSATTTPPRPSASPAPAASPARRRRTSLFAHGEPMVWVTGAAMSLAVFMILSLLLLVLVNGLATFWPSSVVQVTTATGTVFMGEVAREETFVPTAEDLAAMPEEVRARAKEEIEGGDGEVRRQLLRTENFELTGEHFRWLSDFETVETGEPEWAVVFERQTGGRFYGMPDALLEDGKETATGAEATWAEFERLHGDLRDIWSEIRDVEEDELGAIEDLREKARLELRQVELDHGLDSREYALAREENRLATEQFSELAGAVHEKLAELQRKIDPFAIRVLTADGVPQVIEVAEIVRAYPANQLGLGAKLGLYLSRWWEFLSDVPREANSEGGVFPAIHGTILMTLIMTFLVVPFGVLAALYLREYAKSGPIVSIVRIAINNLAGVPSIVFGVFGLGFFCYVIGAGIDDMFFEARLPNPTFGKSGLIWASITLALLTLPVVIIATEEALAAVPGSMREGSYACGASKWQTIRRIVLPRAAPGILTGTILAIARAAGEVAPLMLVGAIKYTKDLPAEVNAIAPYIHVERSFMHLGFHIYDLGFQSPNAEAAKPMVFTTTLLLIGIVVALNVAAIFIRNRLRKRFVTGHF